MTIGDIATRLLDYSNFETTDSNIPTGTKRFILDAVMSALDEITALAPGLFSERYCAGGVLAAPFTFTATIDASTPAQITSPGWSAAPAIGSTIRLTGMASDASITEISGGVTKFAPGYEALASGTASVAGTAYYDCVNVGGRNAMNELRVNGVRLERVASREAAELRLLLTENGTTGLRRVTTGTERPLVWWVDAPNSNADGYTVGVYPIPGARMNWEADMLRLAAAPAEADVFTSTEDFHLDDTVTRSVWLPLARRQFMATPLFTKTDAAPEITRAAQEAEATLRAARPKKPLPRAWNDAPRRVPLRY